MGFRGGLRLPLDHENAVPGKKYSIGQKFQHEEKKENTNPPVGVTEWATKRGSRSMGCTTVGVGWVKGASIKRIKKKVKNK